MFQPLEVTDARTLWIDSPSTERLGFQDSSRVQIDKDPVGTGDFTETGDGFKAKLLGGMWPDDDELRLLVVGVVPGSEMAFNYLKQLVPAGAVLIVDKSPIDGTVALTIAQDEAARDKGMKILRPLVQIMPAWAGQQERTIFVSSTLPRVKPETVKTAAVNSEPDRKLSFDMFRIQVDAMLIANKQEPSDKWKGDEGYANHSVMKHAHEMNATPKEYVDNFLARAQAVQDYQNGEVDGRDTTPSQDTPA